MLLTHPYQPVYNHQSQILILGTFPSVKSRENGFFYGHPQNRFWKVLSALFEDTLPQSIDEKEAFLLRWHIALWDVVHSCEIQGSSDASIKNITPNDLSTLLSACRIRQIFANGQTSARLYNKYMLPATGRSIVTLPSTSPANASYGLERLIHAWQVIHE